MGGTSKNKNTTNAALSKDSKNGNGGSSSRGSSHKNNSRNGTTTMQQQQQQREEEEQQQDPFIVYVSFRFIIITLLGSTMLAFVVGQAARRMIVESIIPSSSSSSKATTMISQGLGGLSSLLSNDSGPASRIESTQQQEQHHQQQQQQPLKQQLPHPMMGEGKKVPRTIYTSKNYDTGRSVTSDSLMAREVKGTATMPQQKKHFENANDEWVKCNDTDNYCQIPSPEEDNNNDDDEEEIHEPAGQHLLIDIEFVDEVFLNSKERLAQAMVDLVGLSGLTLLSYHCHEMEPMGVSCAGVLLESHVSFHTWPIPGVITLDLFTCGPKQLVPLLPLIKQLFAIPRTTTTIHNIKAATAAATTTTTKKAKTETETNRQPHMLWGFKRRGFLRTEGFDAGTTDLHNLLLGVMEFEMKTQVASVETEYQHIEIYDVIHPRFNSLEAYERSLSNDGSYESQHPELFRPDRIVYLDGVMQSRRYGDAGYHEALVHPAMFAHPNPQNVIIIGGGEGATLREVLKHNTVKNVIMVEIDEKMVDVSRTYLPEWSDCSDIVGSTPSCFNDPRVTNVYGDAIKFFLDNWPKTGKGDNHYKMENVDVVIMDALDPGDDVGFSDLLFDNQEFGDALKKSLGNSGIFIAQKGESENLNSANEWNTRSRHSSLFRDVLKKAGFQSLKDYDASHGGFMGVWSFLIAFTDASKKFLWYGNEALVNLKIRKRLRRTLSGELSLKYFDGAAMQSYHFPSRSVETVFCRTQPDAFGCDKHHGIDPYVSDIKVEKLLVKESSIENAGQGVFATETIYEGTHLGLGEAVRDMYIDPFSYSLLDSYLNHDTFRDGPWKVFDKYLNGLGNANYLFGGEDRSIDSSGIATFIINHGCDGSYNVGLGTNFSEQTANEGNWFKHNQKEWQDYIYNPYIDRNAWVLMHTLLGVARRDILAGEEITDNFLNRIASSEIMWKRAVVDLKKQCDSKGARGEGNEKLEQNQHDQEQ